MTITCGLSVLPCSQASICCFFHSLWREGEKGTTPGLPAVSWFLGQACQFTHLWDRVGTTPSNQTNGNIDAALPSFWTIKISFLAISMWYLFMGGWTDGIIVSSYIFCHILSGVSAVGLSTHITTSVLFSGRTFATHHGAHHIWDFPCHFLTPR